MDRKYKIVLLGATGYTGKLTAKYLSECKELEGSNWAIAGRNESSLNLLRDQLTGSNKPSVLTFSLSSDESLDSIVSSSRVVISSVGPYALHGEPIIASCIRTKTHYCDITGESVWIEKMIKKYESSAVSAGIILIPFSGFDSIPSDLGSLFAAKKFSESFGNPPEQVQNFFTVSGEGGGFSGGTIHTMMNIIGSPENLKVQMEKFHLNPEPERQQQERNASSFEKDQILPYYCKEINRWSVPFLMAGTNTRVVRRSAALFKRAAEGEVYSSNFAYNEAMLVPNVFAAWLFTITLGFLLVLLQLSPVRSLVKRWIPQGSGPSSTNGHFVVRSVARGSVASKPTHLVTSFRGPAGYPATAVFCAQVALLLSNEEGINIELKGPKAGFLTPATAFGNQLIERVQANGMTFQVQN